MEQVRMLTTRWRWAVVVMVVAALMGCSSSGGGGGGSDDGNSGSCGDQTSCTVATSTVMGETFGVLGTALAGNSSGVINVTDTTSCLNGPTGTIGLTGSFDSSATDPRDYTLTLMFNHCQFGSPPTDDITMSGTVDITAHAYATTGTGQFIMDSTSLSGTGHYGGTPYDFACTLHMVLNIIDDSNFGFDATLCGETLSYSTVM